MKKYRILIIIGAVVLVVIAVVLIAGRMSANSQQSVYETAAAERGTLTATIGATGNVRANQTAILAWQTSGTVDAVNVISGQKVEAGEVLALLAPGSLPQNVLAAQVDLLNARQSLNNLTQPDVATRAAAMTSLNKAYTGFYTAFSNLNNVINNYQSYGDTELYNDQAGKFRDANSALSTALLPVMDTYVQSYYWASRAAQLGQTDMDYAAIMDAMRSRIDDPVLVKNIDTLVTAQGEYDTAVADFAASIDDTNIALNINQSYATYLNSVATLLAAQKKMYTLTIAPDPIEAATVQVKVDSAQAIVNQAQLTAPFAGTVAETYSMSGDQVSPGTLGFRVDDVSRLLVDVQVTEVDINSIQVGQPVTVMFDAILGAEYNGKVVDVAQAGEIAGGSVSFTVTVELTDADAQVKPGMTAAVTVTVKELADVLLVQNRAVRLVEGQRVVYVLRNGIVEQIAITLGASSDSSSEVVAGDLKEGDLVILNPPANFMTSGGPSFMGR
jgi:HlyD family secretion protein